MIHIRSQVKTRQSYKFKKIAKNSNFNILQDTLHRTRLLKLLDKMHRYEMDPTRTVGTTEWTRDAGTDRRTRVKPIYLPTILLCGGYNYLFLYIRVAPQALGHDCLSACETPLMYDHCPSTNEVTLEDMGQNQPVIIHSKTQESPKTICIIVVMYHI